jgi:hypothetical protein
VEAKMNTKSANTINLVAKLFEIIETRKVAEKLEKDLKAQIKIVMGEDAILNAGDFCVVIETRNRTDLDKTALGHDMGQEFILKYSKRSEYEILSVKSTKRQEVG